MCRRASYQSEPPPPEESDEPLDESDEPLEESQEPPLDESWVVTTCIGITKYSSNVLPQSQVKRVRPRPALA